MTNIFYNLFFYMKEILCETIVSPVQDLNSSRSNQELAAGLITCCRQILQRSSKPCFLFFFLTRLCFCCVSKQYRRVCMLWEMSACAEIVSVDGCLWKQLVGSVFYPAKTTTQTLFVHHSCLSHTASGKAAEVHIDNVPTI